MVEKEHFVFIGAINIKGVPNCGETIKNFILVDYLKQTNRNVWITDTHNWKKKPFLILNILFLFLYFRKRTFVISASTNSIFILTKFLNKLLNGVNCYYFVIGNTIQGYSEKELKYYSVYNKIFVEGRKTRDKFMEMGFSNFHYLPNFKKCQSNISKQDFFKKSNGKLKLVFVSRIIEEKGVYILVDAVRELNRKGYKNRISLDFFGPSSKSELKRLENEIANCSNITYGGILDFFDREAYINLSKYDVMVFPTYWYGEGFPGVLIDAFIAGIAVVATNWSLNTEIIEDGENGIIISPKSVIDLVNAILFYINNEDALKIVKENNLNKSKLFDSNNVLDLVFKTN